MQETPVAPGIGALADEQAPAARAVALDGACGETVGAVTPLSPPDVPAIRTIAMPADTNPAGDIFGGWLMSQMDLAAGSLAARLSRGRCATVAVDGMVFHQPVRVGDEVTVHADLLGIGRSSMRFRVSAWRRTHDSDEAALVTEAVFTFVALGPDGRPRAVPPA
jgi:acyl-CoA thioesterase YciA